MMQTMVTSRASLMIGAAMLVACGTAPVEPSALMQVTAEISRTDFRVGDSVSIRVTARNIGAASTWVSVKTCPATFEILLGGTEVAPGLQVCTMEMRTIKLMPGAAHTYVYDYPAPVTPFPVAPGAYRLRGRLLVEGGMVHSPEIGILVRP